MTSSLILIGQSFVAALFLCSEIFNSTGVVQGRRFGLTQANDVPR